MARLTSLSTVIPSLQDNAGQIVELTFATKPCGVRGVGFIRRTETPERVEETYRAVVGYIESPRTDLVGFSYHPVRGEYQWCGHGVTFVKLTGPDPQWGLVNITITGEKE
jgi:hypothetical protein